MAKKLNQQDVINEFRKIHGDKYDYSLVEYKNDSSKIKIICSLHGIFEQQVAAHKRQNQGCPICGREKVNKIIRTRLVGNENFIKRIEKLFGKDVFDYSKLDYKGAHKEVTLICRKCNNVETKVPNVWYKGFGCLKCQCRRPNPKQITKEQFIERAREIHGNKYNYDKINYVTLYKDVEIICPKHSSFFQKPTIHIHSKSNCPECNVSKGEEQISIFLNTHNIKYIYQHKVKINNSYHYYDFYLPEYNIMIEYNGLQHYKPISFFGGQRGFNYLQERDGIKKEYSLANELNLIILSYKDDIEEILNKTLYITNK